MAEPLVIPWREVSPLVDVNGALEPMLATVDSLRNAWEDVVATATPEEFAEARQRNLRRHAIETGIIERLYDVDWGVTEALVAEGLTLEVAEREGGIDEDDLATIRSQLDALDFLAQAARENQQLSAFFIRQLHQLITRHQRTYQARNDLGQILDLPLHHGEWKTSANHVERPDGSLFQYAPPEQVQHQIENLVALFRQSEAAHPVVRAAWLHHRFILIHPFEDGNGRVGRALVLLVLLEANYAPLVVDRTRRSEYLTALDAANDDDLRPLARLFAELEIVALRAELERPAKEPRDTGAVQVAQAVAQRLTSIRHTTDRERAARIAELGADLHARLRVYLEQLGDELAAAFTEVDPDARATVMEAAPPSDRAHFWHQQLIRTARSLDFFTNLSQGSWWVRLRLLVGRQELRYVVAIQKVGHGETGVLALTCFAELVPTPTDEVGERQFPVPLFEPASGDSVTIVQSESVDARWDEISSFVDRTLAAAVAAFGRNLG